MHDDVYDVWPPPGRQASRRGREERTSHAKPNYVAVEMILPPTDRSSDRMEVTEVATTEIATTFKIWQTGNSYIRK